MVRRPGLLAHHICSLHDVQSFAHDMLKAWHLMGLSLCKPTNNPRAKTIKILTLDICNSGAAGSLTGLTLDLYSYIIEQLPPTPSRFHYIFNLRDLSRVTAGLLLASPTSFTTAAQFVRLWRNEVLRVFHDRLISPEDKQASCTCHLPAVLMFACWDCCTLSVLAAHPCKHLVDDNIRPCD